MSVRDCTYSDMVTLLYCILEESEGIELGEPCQLFKSNEKNKICALKLTIFYLYGHKLSWATAHFVRCNGIKVQLKQDSHNGIKRNKDTYVT